MGSNLVYFNVFQKYVWSRFCFFIRKDNMLFEYEYPMFSELLWQAPELLRDPCTPSRGSQKGDVYSFALILFKIHSRSGPWNHNVYSQKGQNYLFVIIQP